MNPYKVLAVKHDATPHDIVQAAGMALRERKYPAREVAEARKQLMDPQAKMILDFVHSADIESLLNPVKGNSNKNAVVLPTAGTEGMQRLTIFDM